MQDVPKAVWNIPYVSVVLFLTLKQNFIARRSSKMSSRPDCIFEIHQQWQLDFSRVYSNCCCRCSIQSEIIKIIQSSHKMYSNNILICQESTTILNTCKKKSGNLLNVYIYIYTGISAYMQWKTGILAHTHTNTWIYIYMYIYIYIYIYILTCYIVI